MHEKYECQCGYVTLLDVMGNDSDIVKSARVSYNKDAKPGSVEDARLLKYLISHGISLHSPQT